jgi:hypothetical protein
VRTLLVGTSFWGLALIVGCGGNNGGTPLSGMIVGRPWTFVAGQANAAAINGTYNLTTYPGQYAKCTSYPPFDAIYLNQVPNSVGTYAVGATTVDVTFAGSDNINGTGTIVVDAVTTTTISGHADLMSSDPATYATGHFDATICP